MRRSNGRPKHPESQISMSVASSINQFRNVPNQLSRYFLMAKDESTRVLKDCDHHINHIGTCRTVSMIYCHLPKESLGPGVGPFSQVSPKQKPLNVDQTNQTIKAIKVI